MTAAAGATPPNQVAVSGGAMRRYPGETANAVAAWHPKVITRSAVSGRQRPIPGPG